ASGFNSPAGVAIDSAGNLFVADTLNKRIQRVDAATGAVTTMAGGGASGDGCAAATAYLESPKSVVVNPSGNVITIADTGGNRIRLVTFGAATSRPSLTSAAPPSGVAGTTSTIALTGTGFFGGMGTTPSTSCGANGTIVSVSG